VVPAELIEWVGKAGAVAAPIFMFLWWQEREDRRAGDTKIETFSERMLTNAVETKALLQTIVELVKSASK